MLSAPPIDLWRDARWSSVLDWVRRGGTLLLEASDQLSRSAGLKAILRASGVGKVSPSKFTAFYLLPARYSRMSGMARCRSWCTSRPGASRRGASRVIDAADPIAQWDPLKGIVFRMNVIHPNLERPRRAWSNAAWARAA